MQAEAKKTLMELQTCKLMKGKEPEDGEDDEEEEVEEEEEAAQYTDTQFIEMYNEFFEDGAFDSLQEVDDFIVLYEMASLNKLFIFASRTNR